MLKQLLMTCLLISPLTAMEEANPIPITLKKGTVVKKSPQTPEQIRKNRIVRAKVIAARLNLIFIGYLATTAHHFYKSSQYNKDYNEYMYDLHRTKYGFEQSIPHEKDDLKTDKNAIRRALNSETDRDLQLYKQTHPQPQWNKNWTWSAIALAAAAVLLPPTPWEKKIFA